MYKRQVEAHARGAALKSHNKACLEQLLGARELLVCHALLAQCLHLLLNGLHGLRLAFGLLRRIKAEHPAALVAGQESGHRINQPELLAQTLEQAAGHAVAQDMAEDVYKRQVKA